MKKNSDFAKNIFIVSMGPILSSVISFLAEPWISRFWEPFKFGQVSYYNSVISLLSPLLFLRYNFAIVQAENEKERHNLFILSLLVMMVMTGFLLVAFSLFGEQLSKDFPFWDYAWLFFPTLILGGMRALLSFWSSSKKHFVALTLSTIIFQMVNTSLLLIFGFLGLNSGENIVYIKSVSYLIAPLYMVYSFFKFDFKDTLRFASFSSIWSAFKKYRRFPLFDFWGNWAGRISHNIPTILIARYWGQATNGLYAKSYNIVHLLVLFIGDAVNRVFHKEVADMVTSKKNIGPFVTDVVSILTQISILPFVIVILVGPEMFKVVLGENWAASGYYARAISLWQLSVLLSSSVRPLYGVLNRQLQYTVYTITLLAVRIAVFVIMSSLGADTLTTVTVYSYTSMILVIIQFSLIFKIAGASLPELGWKLLKTILILVPLVVVYFAGISLFPFSDFGRLVWVSLLSLPYLYILYYRQESIKNFAHGLTHTVYNKFMIFFEDRWS